MSPHGKGSTATDLRLFPDSVHTFYVRACASISIDAALEISPRRNFEERYQRYTRIIIFGCMCSYAQPPPVPRPYSHAIISLGLGSGMSTPACLDEKIFYRVRPCAVTGTILALGLLVHSLRDGAAVFFYHHASYKRKACVSIMSYSRPVFDEQLTYQGTVKAGGGGIIQMYFLIDLFVAILDV